MLVPAMLCAGQGGRAVYVEQECWDGSGTDVDNKVQNS